MSEQSISTKELRENLPKVRAGLRRGQSYTIIYRSKPIANLRPINTDEDRWETAVDFTKLKKGGIEIDDLLSRL